MNRLYNSYLNAKLRDSRTVSEVERHVAWLADTFTDVNSIALIEISKDDFTIYRAKIRRGKKLPKLSFTVVGEDYPHLLSSLLTGDAFDAGCANLFNSPQGVTPGRRRYDTFFDKYLPSEDLLKRIEEIFAPIKASGIDLVGVCGEFSNNEALLYQLDRLFDCPVVTINQKAINPRDNDRSRSDIDMDLFKAPLSTLRDMKVENILGKNVTFWVPLEESTLCSPFMGDVKWEDLLPDREVHATIAGVNLHLIEIRGSIDCYQNLFLTVRNPGNPHPKIIHVVAPYGRAKQAPRGPKPKVDKAPQPEPPIQKLKEPKGKYGKYYVIDTNVFIDEPDIISMISPEHVVVIPVTVLDELDKKKTQRDPKMTEEKKENCRKAIRNIRKLYKTPGNNLQMMIAKFDELPEGFIARSPDNFILSVAWQCPPDARVILTSDGDLYMKAETIAIEAIRLDEFLKSRKAKGSRNRDAGKSNRDNN